MDHGLKVASNAPVPGAREKGAAHMLIDLGADEYTRGRPHPMIEPELRNEHLVRALQDRTVGVVLLDLVIGYGAHQDPAGLIAETLGGFKNLPLIISSVTGTEEDSEWDECLNQVAPMQIDIVIRLRDDIAEDPIRKLLRA